MTTLATPSAEAWEDLTPQKLHGAVAHLRHEIGMDILKCHNVTLHNCFAQLHPQAVPSDSQHWDVAFSHYLKLLNPSAVALCDRFIREGTPSSIFRGFFDLYAEGVKSVLPLRFNQLLSLAKANTRLLPRSHIEWAQLLLWGRIAEEEVNVRFWVREVCDQHVPLFQAEGDEGHYAEWSQWKNWVAPRFLNMEPSGNLQFTCEDSWNRYDSEESKEIVRALGQKFMWPLHTMLHRLVGDANLRLSSELTSPGLPTRHTRRGGRPVTEQTAAVERWLRDETEHSTQAFCRFADAKNVPLPPPFKDGKSWLRAFQSHPQDMHHWLSDATARINKKQKKQQRNPHN